MTRQTSFHLFFISVLLFLSLVVAAQTESSKLPLVRVKGNQFVAGNDKPLVFRGLDASDPDKLERDGHWNKGYFEAVKSWGANIVRFPGAPGCLA
jgi:endoglucanase